MHGPMFRRPGRNAIRNSQTCVASFGATQQGTRARISSPALSISAVPMIVAEVIAIFVSLIATAMVADFIRKVATGSFRNWLRVKLGGGLGIAELARRLGIVEADLCKVVPSYKVVTIPKRSGGSRRLLVPDPATIAVQRLILRKLLAQLRSHPSAMGFEKNKSVVDNARPHVNQAVVVRMDIVDFFTSTTTARIDFYFRRIGWNPEAAALLTRLTTYENGLPQGAPTSPRLSNLVNYFLDVQLSRFAKRRKGQYTRYADDITFSFPKDYPKRVRGVIQITRRLLKKRGYRLHAKRKLHIRRRHQRQVVTGLIVNSRVNLPRETRRWLRAVKHRLSKGEAATLSPAALQGWLAYTSMVQNNRETTKPT
jgi:RNA-directed DNA polymerase